MLVSDDLEKVLVRSSESQFWDRWVIILGAEKETSPTRGEKHIEGHHGRITAAWSMRIYKPSLFENVIDIEIFPIL